MRRVHSLCKQIVLDTVTISNFLIVDKLNLLCDVYADNLFVTDAVILELRNAEFYIDDWILKGKLRKAIFEYDDVIPQRVSESLGDGEISCILYGIKSNCWIATDDKKARTIIREEYQHNKITGTVGLLMDLVENGTLVNQNARDILEEMKQNGFWYKGDIPF